jgi:hypothetical protein
MKAAAGEENLTPNETIKKLATEAGCPIPGLLALDRSKDPFFLGSDADQRNAGWFRDVWERYGFGTGVHLRRIFYRVVNDPDRPKRPDGEAFENTNQCWAFLGEASKSARCLGLVDPAAFVDRRNPDPVLYADARTKPKPRCEVEQPYWSLPSITIDLECSLGLPEPLVTGYDYQLADQRYSLGLWIEKSTMNDVIEPWCQRFGMDLVTGLGFQSMTTVINMLQRARRHGKAVRIFYISDFDPAGDRMPVSTARHIEFWVPSYAPEIEIKLTHLGLTRQQVIEYGLPRIPIKQSDLRRKGFEDRRGEGAVELDALEAVRPGELARLIEEAVEPYFDSGLKKRLADAGAEADEDAAAAWEDATREEADQLEELQAEAEGVARKFARRAAKLTREFDAAMGPVRERLEVVRHAAQAKADGFQVDLPERPEADQADADESGWLFDNGRSYLDQLQHYKAHKTGTHEEMGDE